MPTFTAIALDRLLEQGASKSAADLKLARRNSTPARANGTAVEDSSTPAALLNRKPSIPVPPPHPNGTFGSKAQWRQISPALYATPESTPLPDSPTSSSPSPYLVNHKRRGPRLQKSSSEANVVKEKTPDDKVLCSSHLSDSEVETKSSSLLAEPISVEKREVNGHDENIVDRVSFDVKADLDDVFGPSYIERESENEDFYDPQESMSFTSNTDEEDVTADQSIRTITPMNMFYDAWEELSSDSGRWPQSSVHDLLAEVRELRLSLLMEIEKRKQAQDALNCMQRQWQVLREKLREVGLVLPADLSPIAHDAQMNVDFTDDICQQIYITRFVSESIGSGAARAECELEMEAQLEAKNFEIARLCDRLHYYETMNQEMSQRNQEAIELARRDRQRRRTVHKWVWGSAVTAIALGSAALAWSYIPSGKGSSSSLSPHNSENTITERWTVEEQVGVIKH